MVTSHPSPPLTEAQILAWADYHKAKTGQWPALNSGAILTVPGQTWRAVDGALREGFRGLKGGDSLSKLLRRERGKRVQKYRLKVGTIVRWAKEHHQRTGQWPTLKSGPVEGCPPFTWLGINASLIYGHCGLPGGTTLSKVLARHCGTIHRRIIQPLTLDRILAWADAHHAWTGRWPTFWTILQAQGTKVMGKAIILGVA